MELLKVVTVLICLCLWGDLLWKISYATTSVHVVQRNGDNVTVRCLTDRLQIIWKIGNEGPYEAESYERNSSLVTSTINTTVTEHTTIVCVGKPGPPFFHQTTEISNITLDPLDQVSTSSTTETLPTSTVPEAPLPVDLQNVFLSPLEGGNINISLSLQIRNVSGQLPQYFRVELQTSAGGNTTVTSTEYRAEDLTPTIEITVHWTPDINVCSTILMVQVSAVNDAGSSVLSNNITIPIHCTAPTPPTRLCVTGCVSENTVSIAVAVTVSLVVAVVSVAVFISAVVFLLCRKKENRPKAKQHSPVVKLDAATPPHQNIYTPLPPSPHLSVMETTSTQMSAVFDKGINVSTSKPASLVVAVESKGPFGTLAEERDSHKERCPTDELKDSVDNHTHQLETTGSTGAGSENQLLEMSVSEQGSDSEGGKEPVFVAPKPPPRRCLPQPFMDREAAQYDSKESLKGHKKMSPESTSNYDVPPVNMKTVVQAFTEEFKPPEKTVITMEESTSEAERVQ